MKKNKFQNYSDGLFFYGDYIETYDSLGNAMDRKEFTQKGKFFFSITSIREQDRYNYDTENSKITMKLKVRYNTILKNNIVILLDNKLYNLKYVDVDGKKENLYLYLTDYKDQLCKHIEIMTIEKVGVMEDDKLVLLKRVWGAIESISDSEGIFTIRYIETLNTSLDKLKKYRIKFNNKVYKIKSINNKNVANEFLEIKGEL